MPVGINFFSHSYGLKKNFFGEKDCFKWELKDKKNHCTRTGSFALRISFPQETADLVTFTDEILNGKHQLFVQ